MKVRFDTKWQVGFSPSHNSLPEEIVQATVPGAVQLDWAKAKGYGPFTYSNNYKNYDWMEDVFWTYATIIPPYETETEEKLFFISKGIDYKFKVLINEETIYEQEGMFSPLQLDVTGKSGSVLKIQIFPAPKRENAKNDRSQADQSVKPPVSYGWDWHPRLIPLGIWDDTYFELRPSTFIVDAEVTYELSSNFDKADISFFISLNANQDNIIVWSLSNTYGDIVFEKREALTNEKAVLNFTLDSPNLWWPNGEGNAYLYTSKVKVFTKDNQLIDEKECKIGFRKVRLVMHPDAWKSPKGHPITRSNPPITIEINGRSIFCKGTNWVNPEIFPGVITIDTYLPLLKYAQEANFNMLRSWGGGIINKDSFFELCDELGLMVWQEFPLACNNYEGTPHYLKILDQESKSIITRLRRHACLVLWCGGNELFNSWSGMTDQSLALRLLNRNCYDLDTHTPFLMTSPLMGMAHGNYLFRYQDGREVFQVMPQSNNTAYTEFGCPGPSPAQYLKTFIPESELFPPLPGTTWETHHAFNAWIGDTWLQPEVLNFYFGKAETLEQLVEWGQLLQCEGYKCIYEEARRQKPTCSMALNWCYNEPWPTAANNSLINWPAQPKLAYYAVKNSCRPVLASARIPRFTFEAGELFSVELWILNDSPEQVPTGRVEAFLQMGDETLKLLDWNYPSLDSRENKPGPEIRFLLPDKDCKQMTLLLNTPDNPEMRSEYILLYKINNN
jgi:beta-mannosidase